MEILFIPNIGDKRKTYEPKWGADFFADAFKKHSSHYVTVEYNLKNINDYDLVWVHNIANLLKGVKGRIELAYKLIRSHPTIIGGVRGEIGFTTARHYIKYFDGIHTSNDKLTNLTLKHNKNSHTLCSGVNLDLFAPVAQPEGFCIGWAGDAKKKMKNLQILSGLRVPMRWAVKSPNLYIPHEKMPDRFYHRINALVHPSSHEGSSRVIAEAAACGLPIICTDVGHNSTIVHPNWMITLNDPVPQIKTRIQLLRDPGVAHVVGMKNLERVKKYSWDLVIGRADDIITQTLNRDR